MKTFNLDDVNFLVTSESLRKIIQGLEMKIDDSSLTVCTDVAFALLEFGPVVSVDCDLIQLRYARKRVELLRNGLCFFPFEAMACKNYNAIFNYFSEPGRLDSIKENLGKIKLGRVNLLNNIPRGNFNKIYLSNILGYFRSINTSEKIVFCLKLLERMKNGGIIGMCGNVNFDDFNLDRLSRIPLQNEFNDSDCYYHWNYYFYKVAPKNL